MCLLQVRWKDLLAMMAAWPGLAALKLNDNRLQPGALSALCACTALTRLTIVGTTFDRRSSAGGKQWHNADLEQLHGLRSLVHLELPMKHQCSRKGLQLMLRHLPSLRALHVAEMGEAACAQIEHKFPLLGLVADSNLGSSSEED